MKMVYKGKLKEEELELGHLSPHAVKFKEPNSQKTLLLNALLFCVPCIFFIAILFIIKFIIWGDVSGEIKFSGVILSLLCIIPHEFLHAICFPKESTVNLYFITGGMAVICTDPVSKRRFIGMSLFPNLVFGILPLILWMFIPSSNSADVLYTFGWIGLLSGCGDYMNIWNAMTQMPKGSVQQLSGFNSYWYYKDDSK